MRATSLSADLPSARATTRHQPAAIVITRASVADSACSTTASARSRVACAGGSAAGPGQGSVLAAADAGSDKAAHNNSGRRRMRVPMAVPAPMIGFVRDRVMWLQSGA
jgi:hypothetical protein